MKDSVKTKAKQDLNKIEKDKDAESADITKAKLIATKADAATTQIDADIKLKAMQDKPKSKK